MPSTLHSIQFTSCTLYLVPEALSPVTIQEVVDGGRQWHQKEAESALWSGQATAGLGQRSQAREGLT